MTPEQHKKYLAYSHLGFAGLYALFMLFFLIFFAVAVGLSTRGPDGASFVFMLMMWLLIAFIYTLMIVPSFIAGFGLLKNRRWARTASIIAGVVAAMQFPLGTAVCVYTFWLLFSEPGKALFEKQPFLLPPGRQAWANIQEKAGHTEYAPPPTPPDWR